MTPANEVDMETIRESKGLEKQGQELHEEDHYGEEYGRHIEENVARTKSFGKDEDPADSLRFNSPCHKPLTQETIIRVVTSLSSEPRLYSINLLRLK